MSRACKIALLSLLLVCVSGGSVLADTGYNPSSNVYATVSSPVSVNTGINTGALTLGTQEAVYGTQNSLTGTTIQHWYVVVTVAGNTFYVDPPVAMN